MKPSNNSRINRRHFEVSTAVILLAILGAGCFTMTPQFKEAPVTSTPQSIKVALLLDSAWSASRYDGGVLGEKHTYLLGDSLVRYATCAAQKSFREVTVLSGDKPGLDATGADAVLRPTLARVQTVESMTTGGGQKVFLVVDWTATNPSDGRGLWKGSIDAEGDDRHGHGSIRNRGQQAFEDALDSLYVKTVTALSNAKEIASRTR